MKTLNSHLYKKYILKKENRLANAYSLIYKLMLSNSKLHFIKKTLAVIKF
jgi:hypothetical protein